MIYNLYGEMYIQAGVLYKTGCYKLPVYVIVIITGRGR